MSMAIALVVLVPLGSPSLPPHFSSTKATANVLIFVIF